MRKNLFLGAWHLLLKCIVNVSFVFNMQYRIAGMFGGDNIWRKKFGELVYNPIAM